MLPLLIPFLLLLLLISTMALKVSNLLFIILWLSLLLLLFREFYSFKYSKIIHTAKQISTVSTVYLSRSSQYSSHSHHPLMSRKVLASNFDFTPFLNHRQQKEKHHEKKQHEEQSEPSAADEDPSQIDPRYGVEKRRVPTGPNPLHH